MMVTGFLGYMGSFLCHYKWQSCCLDLRYLLLEFNIFPEVFLQKQCKAPNQNLKSENYFTWCASWHHDDDDDKDDDEKNCPFVLCWKILWTACSGCVHLCSGRHAHKLLHSTRELGSHRDQPLSASQLGIPEWGLIGCLVNMCHRLRVSMALLSVPSRLTVALALWSTSLQTHITLIVFLFVRFSVFFSPFFSSLLMFLFLFLTSLTKSSIGEDEACM